MKPAVKAILWISLGFGLGALGIGALWWAWPESHPDRSALAVAPPEVLPPSPTPPPAAPLPVARPAPERQPEAPSPPPPGPTAPPAPASRTPREPELPPPAPPPPHGPEVPIGEFFGFPVETLDRAVNVPAPPPRVEPSVVSPAPPAPPAPPALVHLETLPGKGVAGFDGTSTLHDFRGWTKSVSGWIDYEPGRIDATAKAVFVVDARTLDTGDKDRDRAMHDEHLESARYPEMKFTLSEFRSGEDGSCTIRGTLEIHGRSRSVEMAGSYLVRADGLLHVKGQVRAKMSDFGITPPSKVLVIRTADEIKVWFEAWAAPREGTK